MSLTIIVNDLTLVHKGSDGMAVATVPDVCKTPAPGGPIPIPYPNVAVSKDLAKGTTSILVDGGNMAANLGSELALSIGDEPGVAGGVVSSTFIKEATWLLYSFDVMLEGKNACRLTDKMFMNHMNTVCLAGYIQKWLESQMGKKKGKKEECDKLFKKIIDQAFNNPNGNVRGLDGPEGRFDQNTHGGSLGPAGAPDAPRTRGPVGDYKDGANDWETHDDEIKKQQKSLQDDIDEFDDKCEPGSKVEAKALEEAKDIAKRPRPTKEQWDPKWKEPGLSTGQKALIVGAVVLGAVMVVGGMLTAPPSGGGSLAASAAGMAIIAGALSKARSGSQNPGTA